MEWPAGKPVIQLELGNHAQFHGAIQLAVPVEVIGVEVFRQIASSFQLIQNLHVIHATIARIIANSPSSNHTSHGSAALNSRPGFIHSGGGMGCPSLPSVCATAPE